MTVLAILSVGVIPLVKTAVKRQREYQLRESLRMMRESIKEFKRDAVGMQCAAGGLPVAGGAVGQVGQAGQAGQAGGQQQQGIVADPRSKVVIGDCTIFSPENILQYPPSLETLATGVGVVPRMQQVGGLNPGGELPKLGEGGGVLANKKKIYLRDIPVDPMTGQKDWCLHSPFDDPGTCSDNTDAGLFDVTSKSEGTALDGSKYKDW